MFSSKLHRKYLGIAVAAALLLCSTSLFADVSFIGGGSGGGGSSVTGQTVVNGTGTMRSDASMIAGPVGAQLSNNTGTSITAPSFTTDVANAVVLNIYGTTNTQNSTPAADTQLVNVAALGSNNMGLWVGYQTLSSAGASGTQTLGFSTATGAGAVTIPFMPVTGQTIGLSTGATRLQTAVAAGGTSVTINVPSATANGDTLLACEAWYPGLSGGAAVALPPQQPSPATGTQRWINDGAWYGVATAGNGGIQCWHKTASSEPASYSFQTTGSGGVPSGFIADLTNVQNLDVPMTSATGTFNRNNVGNDLCIQGADTSYHYNATLNTTGQGCGQIGVFSSATKIYPNFGNISGSTISSEQYVYGADQGTAIQNAVNATAAGGQVVLGSGIYMMCGGNNTSTCLTFPTGASTVLRGQGRASANWGFAGGLGGLGAGTGINNTNLGTYIVVANTDLAQSAWVWNPGTNSVANNVYFLTIEDLTLWGGVGVSGDGGGAAGFTGTNFSGLSMDRVTIGNFWGDIVDTLASGATGYTDQTHFDRVWFLLSGNGDGWKSAGGSLEAQNEYMIDSQVDNNAKNGIELTGSHATFDVFGSNIQRNDNFNKGSLYEIYCNSCSAIGLIHGDYFENDSGTQNAAVANQVTGWTGVSWQGNIFVAVGAFYPKLTGSSTDAIASVSSAYAGTDPMGVCVLDAAACTTGTYTAGGGTTHCRVINNGSNWIETGMGC